MRHLLVVLIVAACSAKRSPESSSPPPAAEADKVGGAPAPAPESPPPPVTSTAPSGDGENRKQATQQGVMGSTTTSNAEAFAPLEKGVGAGPTPARSDLPTVKLGAPVVKGALDKAIVRRYVVRNIQKIRECLKDAPAGKLTLVFTIGSDGLVASSMVKGGNEAAASCVSDVIKAIEFPKPTKADVKVEFPITSAR